MIMYVFFTLLVIIISLGTSQQPRDIMIEWNGIDIRQIRQVHLYAYYIDLTIIKAAM